MDIMKKIFMAGIGAVALTEEKVMKVVDELVKKGELSEREGKGVLKDVMNQVEDNKQFVEKKIQEHLMRFVKKTRLATQMDIDKLEKRVEKLEALLKEKNKQ